MHRDAKHEETLDGEHVEDAPMAAVSTVPPQACIVRRFHTRKQAVSSGFKRQAVRISAQGTGVSDVLRPARC